jgi:hypothetical protein
VKINDTPAMWTFFSYTKTGREDRLKVHQQTCQPQISMEAKQQEQSMQKVIKQNWQPVRNRSL